MLSIMKKLLTSFFLLAVCCPSFSQIRYDIELLPDNETYLISFVSDVTYPPPSNKIVSGQVTIRMPHGIGPNAFQITDLTMETPGATWQANDIVRAPVEAPSWDYFSFALTTPGVDVYPFQAGVSVPIFSFKNGGQHCADSVYIIKDTDPFLPPNSVNTNVSNSIVILGGGFFNIYGGTVGTGAAPGTPETICTNEMVDEITSCDSVVWQGEIFVQDTVFEIHYTSSVGCDSVFLTEIKIRSELTATVDTVICEGDIFKGVEILQDEVVTQTYTANAGCDSTVTYLIRVVQPSASVTDTIVLPGTVVNGTLVFNDTTIVTTLLNAAGCDSVSTVHVIVYSGQPSIVEAEICLGEDFNGQYYLQDTSFVDTLTSVYGFDSLIITNIRVHQAYFINAFADLCEGQPHTNGIIYTSDTTFIENFQTVYGCDSAITTTIHVVIPEYRVEDTTICYGQLYQGVLYEEDMVFTESIVSASGCDSIVTQVNLTVEPEVPASITGPGAVCAGDVATLMAAGGTQYLWNDGSTTDSLIITAAGTYEVTVTNPAGCTGVAALEVAASGLSAEAEVESPLCHYELSGAIRITHVSGGLEPYAYSIDGGTYYATNGEFLNLSPGEYQVKVTDQYGCFWEEEVTISAPEEIWVEAGNDTEINLADQITFQPTTNIVAIDSVLWTPPEGLDCPTCLSTTARPLQSTTYQLQVWDENGCLAQSMITVLVRPGYEVYVPNAFSPNNDGFNDLFTVFAGDNVAEVRRLAVFERWGGQVFLAEHFQPNALPFGWDGNWRGNPAPEGIYIWMAEVEFLDGRVKLFEGNVNLIR